MVLEDKGWHFMPIRMVDERFGHLGGEIWPPASDLRYRFVWNNFDVGGCDYPEVSGSTELYVCGDGFGSLNGSAISGVDQRKCVPEYHSSSVICAGASHRFALVRKAR